MAAESGTRESAELHRHALDNVIVVFSFRNLSPHPEGSVHHCLDGCIYSTHPSFLAARNRPFPFWLDPFQPFFLFLLIVAGVDSSCPRCYDNDWCADCKGCFCWLACTNGTLHYEQHQCKKHTFLSYTKTHKKLEIKIITKKKTLTAHNLPPVWSSSSSSYP